MGYMRKSILVIEDEVDMREAITTALENAEYHVITAENGQEGLEKALEHEPDLILLDLLMPVMGGQEVLKRLHEHPYGETAKVIILTAMDDITNVGEAYEAGISGYITKSETSLSELVTQVKETLGS
jgi:two-component system alkaline phosphatase synthesis response regulator PhoP